LSAGYSSNSVLKCKNNTEFARTLTPGGLLESTRIFPAQGMFDCHIINS